MMSCILENADKIDELEGLMNSKLGNHPGDLSLHDLTWSALAGETRALGLKDQKSGKGAEKCKETG